MIRALLLVLVMAFSAHAEWAPSGPYASTNTETGQRRVATGGPLRNYEKDGAWRQVRPAWRPITGGYVSDSGRHTVRSNGETTRLDWNGHILKTTVRGLYAYRLSTEDRILLSSPSFSNVTQSGDTIKVTDCYPGVDLRIINTPDDVEHLYVFRQAARNNAATWWANNGSLQDIYIITLLEIDADSLGLTWRDLDGDFDILGLDNRELVGEAHLLIDGAIEFRLPQQEVLMMTDSSKTALHRRMIRFGGETYLAEGFRYTATQSWPSGPIYHFATFGSTTSSSVSSWGSTIIRLSPFNMGSVSGTLDSLYFRGHNWFAGTDTVMVLCYADTAAVGGNLNDSLPKYMVDTSNWVVVSSDVLTTYGADAVIGAAVAANTRYWLGSSGKNGIYASGYTVATMTQFSGNDPWPVMNPFVKAASAPDRAFQQTVYAVYTETSSAVEKMAIHSKVGAKTVHGKTPIGVVHGK